MVQTDTKFPVEISNVKKRLPIHKKMIIIERMIPMGKVLFEVTDHCQGEKETYLR